MAAEEITDVCGGYIGMLHFDTDGWLFNYHSTVEASIT